MPKVEMPKRRRKEYYVLDSAHRRFLQTYVDEYRKHRKGENKAKMSQIVKKAVDAVLEEFNINRKKYLQSMSKAVKVLLHQTTYLRKPNSLRITKKPSAVSLYAHAYIEEHRENVARLKAVDEDEQKKPRKDISYWWAAANGMWDEASEDVRAEYIEKAEALDAGDSTYDEKRRLADKELGATIRRFLTIMWNRYGVVAAISTARVAGPTKGDEVEITYWDSPPDVTSLNMSVLNSNNFTPTRLQKWAEVAFLPVLRELGIAEDGEDDEEVEDMSVGPATEGKKKNPPPVLKVDAEGWPLLPEDWAPFKTGNLKNRKDIIRVFIGMHQAIASGNKYVVGKSSAAWVHYSEPNKLVQLVKAEYLPAEITCLKDPSRMNETEVTLLQEHWMDRQNDPAVPLTFRFDSRISHTSDGSFSTEPANLNPLALTVRPAPRKKVASRKGKERAVEASDDSGELFAELDEVSDEEPAPRPKARKKTVPKKIADDDSVQPSEEPAPTREKAKSPHVQAVRRGTVAETSSQAVVPQGMDTANTATSTRGTAKRVSIAPSMDGSGSGDEDNRAVEKIDIYAGRRLIPSRFASTLNERIAYLKKLCNDTGYVALLRYHRKSKALHPASYKPTSVYWAWWTYASEHAPVEFHQSHNVEKVVLRYIEDFEWHRDGHWCLSGPELESFLIFSGVLYRDTLLVQQQEPDEGVPSDEYWRSSSMPFKLVDNTLPDLWRKMVAMLPSTNIRRGSIGPVRLAPQPQAIAGGSGVRATPPAADGNLPTPSHTPGSNPPPRRGSKKSMGDRAFEPDVSLPPRSNIPSKSNKGTRKAEILPADSDCDEESDIDSVQPVTRKPTPKAKAKAVDVDPSSDPDDHPTRKGKAEGKGKAKEVVLSEAADLTSCSEHDIPVPVKPKGTTSKKGPSNVAQDPDSDNPSDGDVPPPRKQTRSKPGQSKTIRVLQTQVIFHSEHRPRLHIVLIVSLEPHPS
ncbi:hypothetical protein EUX98_g8735 [Antrodiella citrinella]|uniref:Uncharacterized protein n=1 Tax=Antrodiella citrinella TaxID=2447956 RepID=A0A4S4M9K9_9APHY|nr:hypothetical protein EUX98_g8735 [Antrodiella citrinella]